MTTNTVPSGVISRAETAFLGMELGLSREEALSIGVVSGLGLRSSEIQQAEQEALHRGLPTDVVVTEKAQFFADPAIQNLINRIVDIN